MIWRGVIGALAAGGLLAACAQIAGLSDHQPYPVTAITAGADHACLPMNNGDVWCWGDNTYGQLGDGTATGPAICGYYPCSPVPVAVPLAGGMTATSIAEGDGTSYAVGSNGTLYA